MPRCHDQIKPGRDSFAVIAAGAVIRVRMSSIGRIIAGARDLSVGGPLGALLVRAARSVPSRLTNRFGSPRPRDPKRRVSSEKFCYMIFARNELVPDW